MLNNLFINKFSINIIFYVVFVNGIAITESKLSIGDIVSIMNLRIIICGTYIIMNKAKI